MMLYYSFILFILSTASLCVTKATGFMWNSDIVTNFFGGLSVNSSSGAYQIPFDDNPSVTFVEELFDHHVVLSESGDVKLSWSFDEENITLKLSAPTYGWIGIGISKDDPSKVGSDFIVMGSRRGESYVVDAFINENGTFQEDESQDVVPEFIWEDGLTYGTISRPLITCDRNDVDITKDTLRVSWAYGRSDINGVKSLREEIKIHKEGFMDLKLLNPSMSHFSERNRQNRKSIVVRANNFNVLESQQRHCMAFRFPDVTNKIHVTEFQPKVQKAHQFNVRRIIVKECSGSFQDLNGMSTKSVDCKHDTKMANCSTIILAWGPSMKTFAFPPAVGYPVTSSNVHFVMEIQYINDKGVGFMDSSGMKIYYTQELREHDFGVLTTGSLVHKSQLIPPRSSNFRLQGHCMSECIGMSISEDVPVKIFTATLHAREAGRKIHVRHFRGGKELLPVTKDNAFRHDHYETEYIPRSIDLRKGDNMIVECSYDTGNRDEIIFVNNSKGGESCLAYLGYYPRNVKLTACETAPTESVIMATVGAERPEEMLKNAEKFPWTYEQTKIYNNRLLKNQVYVHCGDFEFDHPKPVPKISQVFIEEHKCPMPQPDRLSTVDTTTTGTTTISVTMKAYTATSGAVKYQLRIMMALLPHFALNLIRLQHT